ncbi:MAG: RNA pyrophosphohydrolase [Alphaproteobacteria bacterium]|nr:RNA pyrophosphohydrolase [Alphaproteobacteria bacterium]
MSALYRKNVGIVVFNDKHKVLMCARADKPDMQWQFPQGGVEDGEPIVAAARRELQEETGLTSVELVATMPNPLRYDFPQQIVRILVEQDCLFVGQEQYWVLFYFTGNDKEIDFYAHPEEIEFKAYEWVDIYEAPQRIVEFKKEVYKEVAKYFSSYIYNNSEITND